LERKHWGQHEDGCFACKAKSVNLAPSATPSRNLGKQVFPQGTRYNAWERGVVSEPRPDGSRMPLVNKDLSYVSTKQYAENSRHFRQIRKTSAEVSDT
jgi:hypothetical protein